jgi:coatomer subunit beta
MLFIVLSCASYVFLFLFFYFILLHSNAILNDLKHPNEWVRGCTLRFLCKLNEPEILEPLVPAIKGNLEDRTPFVRRNAVLCVYSVYKSFPDLLPDAPADVEAFLKAESDTSSRRNAFMMLFQVDLDRAVSFLVENEEEAQKFGDSFQLVILELVRKVCRINPQRKSAFSMLVYNMLSSKSPAVVYEAAWTLVSLTGAVAAVRAAATAYTQLLTSSSSDNNIKLIVLDRLGQLRSRHMKVLQELTMDVLRALATPNPQIRTKVLDIAMTLLAPKNVEEVVLVLKKEMNKTRDAGVDKTGVYRQNLIKAMHVCAERFPKVTVTVIPVLLEFMGDKGALDVVTFVRRMIRDDQHLQTVVLERIIASMSNIKTGDVYRVVLWILGEYSTTPALVDQSFQAIASALGPLPITPSGVKIPVAPEPETKSGGTMKTSVTVLGDGTYATQTVYSEEATAAALTTSEDQLPLRQLVTEGNSFVASVVCATLTKLVVRASDMDDQKWSSQSVKKKQIDAILIMCSMVRLGQTLLTSKARIDKDSFERITLWLRMLVDPATANETRKALLHDCSRSFEAMLEERKIVTPADVALAKSEIDTKREVVSQPDSLISFRQLRENRLLGAKEVDLDDEADVTKATGMKDGRVDFRERLKHIYQLTGFADPIYSEACVAVHDYDIVLDVLVLNRTDKTLSNLTVEMSTIGDLKIVDRPQNYVLGPYESKTVKCNIKVSSTDSGQIFGNIVYDSTTSAEHVVLNLHDIKIDIMDYIHPATCDETTFRQMWAEFEWENKVAVNTKMVDLKSYLNNIISITNTNCLTPARALAGDCKYIAANLYARSSFGEDALVNVSVELEELMVGPKKVQRIIGSIRIRSKTQGIALSLGDRIGLLQRKPVKKED